MLTLFSRSWYFWDAGADSMSDTGSEQRQERVYEERPADPSTPQTDATDHSPQAARREVLKRLGVYGAFVAPALLTALTSSASAQALPESGVTN